MKYNLKIKAYIFYYIIKEYKRFCIWVYSTLYSKEWPNHSPGELKREWKTYYRENALKMSAISLNNIPLQVFRCFGLHDWFYKIPVIVTPFYPLMKTFWTSFQYILYMMLWEVSFVKLRFNRRSTYEGLTPNDKPQHWPMLIFDCAILRSKGCSQLFTRSCKS